MIRKIDYDDGLPISVIIPTTNDKVRKTFFENFVLPSIEANEPVEIIINDNSGGAPKKRNDGFDKTTQPFVFFCDNDIILPQNHLKKLLDALKNNRDIAFAYSGYHGIVMNPATHPVKHNYKINTYEFNVESLKRGNYISTMSLIRKEKFPRFDESLKRLQDWDLWLTIVKNGGRGVAVYNNEFHAYYLDAGITANSNSEVDAMMVIRQKHNL